MCGLLGSSKRLPTAAEPALRPMGAVPRGAEDTCHPPELFVAHHAAPGPAAGLAACSLRRPLPRAALPRGRGGDSVPRGSSAASPRPAARPPTRLDVPCSLLRAYLSSKKKKSGRGKTASVAGCLPCPQQRGPAAAPLAGAALSSPQSGAGSQEAFHWGESQPSAAGKGCSWDVFACSTALSLSVAECKTPWKICWPLVLNSLVITAQATTNSNPWFLLKRTCISSFPAA